MDVLSDVLRTVRLSGSIFFTGNFYEPWAFSSPTQKEISQNMPSKAESISFFHIIVDGTCRFKTENGRTYFLKKDSVVIFPHASSHIVASNLSVSPAPILQLLPPKDIAGFPNVEYGGDGDKTQFICGYLVCDQRFNPFLGALPEAIILSPINDKACLTQEDEEVSPNTLSIHSGSWLEMTINQLTKEVFGKNEGGDTLITRLSELLYVVILRRYMNHLPDSSRGWLAAIRDPEIGSALKYLHAHPEVKWNVMDLASKVGLSRSAFARRFTDLVGESPIQYLTGWRMQLAKNFLLQPDLSMAMVAEKVGYDSDIAFNRAFKRCVGEPPGYWRDHSLK